MGNKQEGFAIALAIAIIGLLAVIFFVVYSKSNDETYVIYEIDESNRCFWANGKADYGTKATPRFSEVKVKKSEAQNYLKKAEVEGSCVFPVGKKR